MKINDSKKIATILKYQENELKELKNNTIKKNTIIENRINESELLLSKLGYDIKCSTEKKEKVIQKKVIYTPSFEELYSVAFTKIGKNIEIDELFTKEELKNNEKYIQLLNKEYNSIHQLDIYDISISVIAGLVGATADILLVGIPEVTKDGLKAGPLSNYIREYFDKIFPEDEMNKLANSKISKVPYDAQDNRNTKIHVEGLSAYYHRLLQPGHDPSILGLLFGVADILNGTMTTIDKKGNFVIQTMECYANRTEQSIFEAIAKLFIHYASDITTSMGLPAPLMSLFNFMQFGKIGEYEQTIAEIVQGMYYEGYDFIHFCSMSVPTMLVEVITRIGYGLKRKIEGHSLKESLPFSLDRDKKPKLSTMLFIAHSSATAINAGKVVFTENPLAINYPQWISFAKYSFTQLKWTLIDKPNKRDKYVHTIINDQLEEVYAMIDDDFNKLSEKYIIIMN